MSSSSFSSRTTELARRTAAALLLARVVSTSTDENAATPLGRAQQRGSALSNGALTAMGFLEDLFTIYIPRLVIFLIVLFFGIVLARVVPYFVDVILAHLFVPRHYRVATRYVLRIAIFIAALWLALAVIGIDFFAIIVTFGVFSLVISVGISNLVSNVFAGITIQIEDLAEPGYDVSVNGIRGIVLYTTITNVVMRRIEDDADVVYVPNNFFVQYPVRRHITDVGVQHRVISRTLLSDNKTR